MFKTPKHTPIPKRMQPLISSHFINTPVELAKISTLRKNPKNQKNPVTVHFWNRKELELFTHNALSTTDSDAKLLYGTLKS